LKETKPAKVAPPPAAPAPVVAAKAAPKKPSSSATPVSKLTFAPLKPTPRHQPEELGATIEAAKGPVKMTPFLKKQKQRLIELRDTMLNLIEGVSRDSLRQRAEGGEASAFGMHQADAGSDAYDRDFALSLLSQEQDSLNEINEAMTRMENGTYGICEMSGKKIPEIRLEALPFTRYTVECQEQIERRQMGGRGRVPVRSLFGLDEASDESGDDGDEEDTSSSSRNNNSESLDFAKD
jgi:RNA polymerase-binding transcription factor DksA